MKLPIPSFDEAFRDLEPLLATLTAAFQVSAKDATAVLKENDLKDAHFFSHLLRYYVKVYLKKNNIAAEDCTVDDVANTGLSVHVGRYHCRILMSPDGVLPDAGLSDRRTNFMNQRDEQSRFGFMDDGQSSESDFIHLLILYSLTAKGEFSHFNLACPQDEQHAYFNEPVPSIITVLAAPKNPQAPPEPDLGYTRKDKIGDTKTVEQSS